MKRFLFFLAAVAVFAGCSEKKVELQPVDEPSWYAHKTYFQEKNSLYVELPLNERNIVIFGDDIADRGEWMMFYNDTLIRNRGISLEGSDHTLYRTDAIASQKPAKIFVSTGMRDVICKDSIITAEATAANIMEIFRRAHILSPKTELYFMSIIPNGLMDEAQAERARKINDIVKAKAKNFTYIDVTTPLVGENGIVSDVYCWDKFNLNGAGYEVLAKTLEKYVGEPALNKANDRKYPESTAHYRNRVSIFNSLPVVENSLLFLGNSLTNNSQWYELMPSLRVLNRGISGDRVLGIYNRLDDVIDQKPATIVLLSGLNDFLEDKNEKASNVWKKYQKIITKIQSELPGTPLYICSTLPINPKSKFYDGVNPKVAELNKLLEAGANSYGYTYIDVASGLVDENGDLDSKYTFDGIHIAGAGYLIWADKLIMSGMPNYVYQKQNTVTE